MITTLAEDKDATFDLASRIGGPAMIRALADYYADMATRWSHDTAMVKTCADMQAIALRAADAMANVGL